MQKSNLFNILILPPKASIILYMKLILIRHGKTKEDNVILGHLPGHLSEIGKEEAKRIAKTIKTSKLNPEIIISSNLNRAKETSEIISQEIKIPIEFSNLIIERGGGIVEGKKDEDAEEFLNKILDKPYKSILIVPHNVFLCMLLSVYYELPIKEALQYNLKNKVLILDTDKKTGVVELPLLS